MTGRIPPRARMISSVQAAWLREIASGIPHPKLGLPDEVFAFALHIVPMINVDLVTFDEAGRTLLAWRRDTYGEGWHVPGGIVRGEETLERRIAETARAELFAPVEPEPAPSAIIQFHGERGTFVSLVFRCRLADVATGAFTEAESAEAGELSWFARAPARLYPAHGVYRELLPQLAAGRPTNAPLMRTARYSAAMQGWRVNE